MYYGLDANGSWTVSSLCLRAMDPGGDDKVACFVHLWITPRANEAWEPELSFFCWRKENVLVAHPEFCVGLWAHLY